MDQVLERRKIRGVVLQEDTILCEHRDTIYLFLDSKGRINYFELTSAYNIQLPDHDPSIHADIISLSFTPSHTYAIAGFADGSIQLYDLKSKKLSKTYISLLDGPITSFSFISDNIGIASNGSQDLYKSQISSALLRLSVNKTKIHTFDFPIVAINCPTIYVSGETTKCIAPLFQNFISVSCSGRCYLIHLAPSVRIVHEVQTSTHVSSFYLYNQETLFFTIAERKMIRVFEINDKLNVKQTYEHEIECDPIFVSFLQPYIVVVVSKNNDVFLVYYTEDTFIKERLPSNGIIVKGENEFFHIDKGVLSAFKLITFKDRFETLNASGDFQALINFCKLAKNGEASACIGLPSNPEQRAVIIERMLGTPVENYIKAKFEAKEDPSQIATDFITLSKSLNMKRLIVEKGVSLFDNYNACNNLFKAMIEIDSTASYFEYDTHFVERLLKDDINITDKVQFAMRLPSKVCRTSTLLRYASNTKNYLFLAELFKTKIKDPIRTLSALELTKDPKSLCQYLFDILQDLDSKENKLIIKWLLTTYQHKDYFRLSFIMSYDDSIIQQIFTLTMDAINQINNDYTTEKGSFITPSQFLDIIMETLLSNKENMSQNAILFLETAIINKKVQINPNKVSFLLQIIFAEENRKNYDELKEKLFLKLLETSIPANIQENFVDICTIFNYHKSKRHIYLTLKRYDQIIFDILSTASTSSQNTPTNKKEENVFLFIVQNIRPNTKDALFKGITKNAKLLLTYNSKETITILLSFFKDKIFDFIFSIDDYLLSMSLLRIILNDKRGSDIKLDQNTTVSYLKFLAEKFPKDVLKFLKTIELDSQYTDICNRYSVFDASCYIEAQMHQYKRAYELFRRFIILTIVKYCSDEITDKNILKDDFNFIAKFIDEQCKIKPPDLEDNYPFFIRCFALPLSKEKENCSIVKDTIKKVCLSLCDFVPHQVIIEHVIKGYKEVDLGHVRDFLLQLINDFEFSIQIKESIHLVFKEDEDAVHSKYIASTREGVQIEPICSHCKEGLSGSDFTVFSCGHAFHSYCCNSDNCPICNNSNVNQNSEKSKESPMSIKKKLSLFEQQMKSNNKTESLSSKGKIVMKPISRISLTPN